MQSINDSVVVLKVFDVVIDSCVVVVAGVVDSVVIEGVVDVVIDYVDVVRVVKVVVKDEQIGFPLEETHGDEKQKIKLCFEQQSLNGNEFTLY